MSVLIFWVVDFVERNIHLSSDLRVYWPDVLLFTFYGWWGLKYRVNRRDTCLPYMGRDNREKSVKYSQILELTVINQFASLPEWNANLTGDNLRQLSGITLQLSRKYLIHNDKANAKQQSSVLLLIDRRCESVSQSESLYISFSRWPRLLVATRSRARVLLLSRLCVGLTEIISFVSRLVSTLLIFCRCTNEETNYLNQAISRTCVTRAEGLFWQEPNIVNTFEIYKDLPSSVSFGYKNCGP